MIHQKLSLSVLFILVLLLFSFSAHSYTYINGNPKWPFKSMPVGWVLNENCSEDLSFEACEQAVKDSFETWTEVECSTMIWNYLGTSTLDAEGDDAFSWNSDGTNLMAWREDSWPNDLYGAIAVTMPIHRNGTFQDTDIVFNGYHFEWGVNGERNKMDIAHIATHEIGHALGLDHSEDPSATMYYATQMGLTNSRTLEQDDIDGICSIYPAGTANAEVGSECNTICEEDPDFFCGWYRGTELCTTTCTTPDDCPDNFRCGYLDYIGYSCWNEGEAAFSEECTEDWDCKKNYYCRKNDIAQICTEICPTECPNGFACSKVNGEEEACMPIVSAFLGQCNPELCEEPYNCLEVSNGTYCTLACTTSLDCPNDSVCSDWNGKNICYNERNPIHAEITSFTADATRVKTSEIVTFTAEATSPNQVLYQFKHQLTEGNFEIAREYGTKNMFEWKAESLGKHVFIATVIDTKSMAEYDDAKQVTIEVVENTDPSEDGDVEPVDGDTSGGSGATGGSGCNSLPESSQLLLLILLSIVFLSRKTKLNVR